MEFKTFLVNSYGALALRQASEAACGEVFRIDSPNRNNNGVFCSPIYIAVTGLDRFVLKIASLPMHDKIEQLVRQKGGDLWTVNSRYGVSLTLETADFEFVSHLSSMIRDCTASRQEGANGDDESTGARTAEVLSDFAGLLKQYSVQTRGIEKTRPDGLFAS
jgi:hypothetical protein